MPGAIADVLASVVGVVSWEQRDAAGRVVESGEHRNLWLNEGRSAIATRWWFTNVSQHTMPFPYYLHIGTGTAVPQPTDTALQFFLTSVVPSANPSIIGAGTEGGFTGRRIYVLGPTEVTGWISELMLNGQSAYGITAATATPSLASLAYARVLITSNHRSGQTMTIIWRAALQA